MKRWIISYNGKVTAPLTEAEAIVLLQQHPDSYVWHPSFSQWQPAASAAAFAGKVPQAQPLPRVSDELIAAFNNKQSVLTERLTTITQSTVVSRTYLSELDKEISIYKRLTNKLSDEVKQGIGGIENSYLGYQNQLAELSNSLGQVRLELSKVSAAFEKCLEQNQVTVAPANLIGVIAAVPAANLEQEFAHLAATQNNHSLFTSELDFESQLPLAAAQSDDLSLNTPEATAELSVDHASTVAPVAETDTTNVKGEGALLSQELDKAALPSLTALESVDSETEDYGIQQDMRGIDLHETSSGLVTVPDIEVASTEFEATLSGISRPVVDKNVVADSDYDLVLLEPEKEWVRKPSAELASPPVGDSFTLLPVKDGLTTVVNAASSSIDTLQMSLAQSVASVGEVADRVAIKAALDKATFELKLAERVAQAKAAQEKAAQEQEKASQEKAALEFAARASSEHSNDQFQANVLDTAKFDSISNAYVASDLSAQLPTRSTIDPVASRLPAGMEKSLFGIDPEAFFAKLTPPPPKSFLAAPPEQDINAATRVQTVEASATSQITHGAATFDASSKLDLPTKPVKLQSVTSIFKSIFKGEKKEQDGEEFESAVTDDAERPLEEHDKPKQTKADVEGRMRRRSRRRG